MSKGNQRTIYDMNFVDESGEASSAPHMQLGSIEYPEDVRSEEDTTSDPDEYFKDKMSLTHAHTNQKYKRQEHLSDNDQFSTKEDKRKDRRFEHLSDHALKKDGKKRDRRDEHVSSYDETKETRKREDKHHKHQRKSKVASNEKEFSSHETPHRSKGRSDALQHQRNLTGVDDNIGGIVVGHNQSRDDFAVVENQGTIKHILMLGTIGSGKYTIAKNISSDSRNFPARSSLRKQSGIIQCIDDGALFKFVLVDTGGARMPDVWGAKGPTISEIAAKIKHHLKSGISLIMVVVRYDCDTPEDLQVLANMIDALFTNEAKQHIALVHNGCENLSEEGIKQYIKHFNAQGPSGRLASLCGKTPALVTSFPNLREAKVEMTEDFEQAIEESKKKLSTVIESCKFLQPYSEILKANNDPSRVFPDSKQDCCVM